ncbi:S8 family serine peptidase [Streptosporangium sp. NBC_01756]|uniref:S8 family serine peptidase n=1 Tax=Streptosporangium sp. NBC_01756 TaxID=2975950 RepID=UPI002DDA177F|nr:S8 family serine peptidase [Streptosporangium sp. NBC_01756]WSC87844.1 S8 family serine peptidase [Streptosporangium sp. NBC_01756]
MVDALKDTAKKSQRGMRKFLSAKGLKNEPYWVANAVYVKGATAAQAKEIAELDGVTEVRAPRVYAQPEPVQSRTAAATADGLEWGVANINADDVWQQYGKRGEDIVIANIDTGVQYDHPALVGSYRGNNGDGTFTHDYNWYDPSGHCPSGAPCDTHGHGTHTMGTMAGDDGQGNQIGVAPGVRWIAANGCAACSDVDLAKSAQWMLAPTDANGENPDVSKRPHIINNSWGSDVATDEPLIEEILTAWAAPGIFGVWANGNLGSACKTSGSPGSRSINYSVGAYDVNNVIAPFSSRGPGQDGHTKPNISAPGSDVRSAIPGGYGIMSGTSMAAPHVSGAIALLWSAFPGLVRDLEGTRTLLDNSAIDTADAQCGGPAEYNNVYGEGRLDAAALLSVAQRGLGTLTGTVTDAGKPVKDAAVSVTGPTTRETTTDADGGYLLRLPSGEYQLTVKAFGYTDLTTTVTVAKDGSVTKDLSLVPVPRVAVSGTIKDGSGHGSKCCRISTTR